MIETAQRVLYQGEAQQGPPGYPLGAWSLNHGAAREVEVSISEMGVGRVFVLKYFLAPLHYLIQNQKNKKRF